MLNLVACCSFLVATICVVVMLCFTLANLPETGRMVCRVCFWPAREIEHFICPGCRNDTRQWGIFFLSSHLRREPLERVLSVTLVVSIIAAAAWSLAALAITETRQQVESRWSTFSSGPLQRIEIVRVATADDYGDEIVSTINGAIYRSDGLVCDLELSGPPWSGKISPPDADSIHLSRRFDQDTANQWLAAALPSDTSSAIREKTQLRIRGSSPDQISDSMVMSAAGGMGSSGGGGSSSRNAPGPATQGMSAAVLTASSWLWVLIAWRTLRRFGKEHGTKCAAEPTP